MSNATESIVCACGHPKDGHENGRCQWEDVDIESRSVYYCDCRNYKPLRICATCAGRGYVELESKG